MPIGKTLRDVSLVGAEQFIPDAARAEGLTTKKVENLWMGLDEAARNGLINHAKETEASLAGWRAGFASVFAELTDAEASALIRIAVMMTGGTIVEAPNAHGDAVVTDTKAKKA